MSTAEIIRDLCKKNGVSITSLEQTLGFGNGSILKSKVMASDRLADVARFFNVSMEYLMDMPEPDQTSTLSCEEYDLISSYRKLSPEGRNYIIQTMNMAVSSFPAPADVKRA